MRLPVEGLTTSVWVVMVGIRMYPRYLHVQGCHHGLWGSSHGGHKVFLQGQSCWYYYFICVMCVARGPHLEGFFEHICVQMSMWCMWGLLMCPVCLHGQLRPRVVHVTSVITRPDEVGRLSHIFKLLSNIETYLLIQSIGRGCLWTYSLAMWHLVK